MLKGVTKRTIEIKIPESNYFDGALFFIKPSAAKNSRIYRDEAKKYLSDAISGYDEARLRKTKALNVVLLISLGLMLAAFAVLLILYTKTGL